MGFSLWKRLEKGTHNRNERKLNVAKYLDQIANRFAQFEERALKSFARKRNKEVTFGLIKRLIETVGHV